MASLDFNVERDVFKEFYATNAIVHREAADSLRTLIGLLLSDNDAFPTPQVICRVKERDECIAKFARKYQTACESSQTPYSISDYITDLVGVRVICLYESDVPLARQLLIDSFDLVSETDKSHNIDAQEAAFGYKGLHLDLRLAVGRRDLPEYRRFRDLRFEVQIRTIVQDAWSVLDHKIKYKKEIPLTLKRRINRLAALFELADQEFLNIRNETARLEAAAVKAALTAAPIEPESLDAFSFLSAMRPLYPNYTFAGEKVDGFVSELLRVNSALTQEVIATAIAEGESVLAEYRAFQHERFRNRLNPYTLVRHALYLYDKTQYSAILFDFQRTTFDTWILGQDPGDLARNSVALAASGRYEEAIRAADAATRLFPNDLRAWRSLATSLSQSGEHELARKAWKGHDQLVRRIEGADNHSVEGAIAAVRADWVNPAAWGQLARTLDREGRGLEAIEEAQQTLEVRPQIHHSLVPLVEWLTGPFPDATLSLLDVMRKLDPSETHYIHLSGVALRKGGKDGEALTYLRRACDANPGKANYWYALGRCLEDVGAPRDDVVKSFRAAVAAETPPHKKALEKLRVLLGDDSTGGSTHPTA